MIFHHNIVNPIDVKYIKKCAILNFQMKLYLLESMSLFWDNQVYTYIHFLYIIVWTLHYTNKISNAEKIQT